MGKSSKKKKGKNQSKTTDNLPKKEIPGLLIPSTQTKLKTPPVKAEDSDLEASEMCIEEFSSPDTSVSQEASNVDSPSLLDEQKHSSSVTKTPSKAIQRNKRKDHDIASSSKNKSKSPSGPRESTLEKDDDKLVKGDKKSSKQTARKQYRCDSNGKSGACLEDTKEQEEVTSFALDAELDSSKTIDLAWEGDTKIYSPSDSQKKRQSDPTSSSEAFGEKTSNVSPAKQPLSYQSWCKQAPALLQEQSFEVIEEVEADLFSMDKKHALAHCVAADMNMGAGIALTFRLKFKSVGRLLAQNVKPGGVAFLEVDGQYIYYLVTKSKSSGKPTLQTMFNSLSELRSLMIKHGVSNIAIPRIGCGLDLLEWPDVKCMIEFIFKGTDIKFTVCNFVKADEMTREMRAANVNKTIPIKQIYEPIRNVPDWSVIVYLGNERGIVDKQFETLSERFPQIGENYRQGGHKLGDLLETVVDQYKFLIFGCVVRRDALDPVDFQAFSNTLREINKKNAEFYKSKESYAQVVIQEYSDKADYVLMSKLINLVRTTLNSFETLYAYMRPMKSSLPPKKKSN